jgi:serine/threonine protein kinase
MADDGTQPATQHTLDPRRLGRNNSGLHEEDVSDVMCILSPGSPAAFRTVTNTATKSPQHILQNQDFQFDDTYIHEDGFDHAQDIALRFSSVVRCPEYGFVFGRNPHQCDVLLSDDLNGATRRISNMHFRIYLNSGGIAILEDVSTNGTMVDETLLAGKNAGNGASNILQNGSIIQVLSPLPEHKIIFHVRVPPRDGFEAEYTRKAEAYMRRMQAYRRRAFPKDQHTEAEPRTTLIIPSRSFGMKWDGRPKYTVTGFLGKGAFANVYQLTTLSEGRHFAVKELEKRRYVKDGILDRKLSNEMEIMKSIKHPHIVEYVEYHDIQDHLYIIMEYVPCGDLQAYLKHGVLSESKAIPVARQTLLALDYLHRNNITHRDIKPDNILIASDNPFTIKLSDFGLSKVKKEDTFLKTFCGTLLYCAPEVFPHYQNEKKGTKRRHSSKTYSYTHAVDIWSLAGVMWFALCGSPPFEGVVDPTGRGMFEKIMYTELNGNALDNAEVSEDAKDLLTQMLSTEPERRPTARQCLRHRWLDDGQVPEGPENGLDAIDEEAEEAQKFSQLSLHDLPSGGGASFPKFEYIEEEDYDEISEIDFGVSRSKRVKTDARFPRNQMRTTSEPESSEELSGPDQQSMPRSSGQTAGPSVANRRLFGEIGLSALQDSDVLSEQAKAALQRDPRPNASNDLQHLTERLLVPGTQPPDSAASLFGTESLVRDLNMQSPHCSDSFSSPESSLNSYRDTELPNRQILSYSSEETPRAIQSKNETPVDVTPTRPSRAAIPDTANASAASMSANLKSDSFMPKPIPPSVALEWQTNPPRYGTLITTIDSEHSFFLRLEERSIVYGRQAGCQLIYPFRDDSRVPRVSFCLVFNASNIEAVIAAGGDWTTLDDLHVLIKNFSKNARLWINDSVLPSASDEGIDCCGRVYTGDVITIFQPHDGEDGECMRFVCNFFVGEGRNRRERSFVKEVTIVRRTQTRGDLSGLGVQQSTDS